MIIVSSGHFHTCAISVDSSLHCWGNNEYGQCNFPYQQDQDYQKGNINSMKDNGGYHKNINQSNSDRLILNSEIIHVASGYGHTCSARRGSLDC